MLSLSEARRNFILEMYAKDNPERMKFTKASDSIKADSLLNTQVDWADKLMGKAKEDFVRSKRFDIPKHISQGNKPKRYDPPKP